MATDYTPPGYMELWDTALEYLRGSRPTLYRRLRRERSLDDHIDLLIRSTRDCAAALIAGGEQPPTAWNRAIREQILASGD